MTNDIRRMLDLALRDLQVDGNRADKAYMSRQLARGRQAAQEARRDELTIKALERKAAGKPNPYSRAAIDACPLDEFQHIANLDVNRRCPWCGATA